MVVKNLEDAVLLCCDEYLHPASKFPHFAFEC